MDKILSLLIPLLLTPSLCFARKGDWLEPGFNALPDWVKYACFIVAIGYFFYTTYGEDDHEGFFGLLAYLFAGLLCGMFGGALILLVIIILWYIAVFSIALAGIALFVILGIIFSWFPLWPALFKIAEKDAYNQKTKGHYNFASKVSAVLVVAIALYAFSGTCGHDSSTKGKEKDLYIVTKPGLRLTYEKNGKIYEHELNKGDKFVFMYYLGKPVKRTYIRLVPSGTKGYLNLPTYYGAEKIGTVYE